MIYIYIYNYSLTNWMPLCKNHHIFFSVYLCSYVYYIEVCRWRSRWSFDDYTLENTHGNLWFTALSSSSSGLSSLVLARSLVSVSRFHSDVVCIQTRGEHINSDKPGRINSTINDRTNCWFMDRAAAASPPRTSSTRVAQARATNSGDSNDRQLIPGVWVEHEELLYKQLFSLNKKKINVQLDIHSRSPYHISTNVLSGELSVNSQWWTPFFGTRSA